jgi:hypothetical protein
MDNHDSAGQLVLGFRILPYWVPCGCLAVFNFTTNNNNPDNSDKCCHESYQNTTNTPMTTAPPTNPIPQCKADFQYYAGNCYFFSLALDKQKAQNAQTKCQEKQSNLTSVHTDEENRFIHGTYYLF